MDPKQIAGSDGAFNHRRLAVIVLVTLAAFLLHPWLRGETGSALLVIVFCMVATIGNAAPFWSLPLLVIAASVSLVRFDGSYAPWSLALSMLHPVLLVFACGLAFAVAANLHGIDRRLVRFAVERAHNNYYTLVFWLVVATVWLSAWISNIAAAGLMFAAVAPAVAEAELTRRQRDALFLALAVAANLGGMVTPLGTGANAVAIAALGQNSQVGFVRWALFAVPLGAILIAAGVVATFLLIRPGGQLARATFEFEPTRIPPALPVVFGATIVLWLLEPVHNVPAHWIAAAAILALLTLRVLPFKKLVALDWSVLMLIAGGIGIGLLVHRSGLAQTLLSHGSMRGADAFVSLLGFCAISALLSAIMSNTGTAAALIPIAAVVLPGPSTPILIALATCLGFPFVISTPANALAIRNGVKQSHLFAIGFAALVLGSLLLASTGREALSIFGVPRNP